MRAACIRTIRLFHHAGNFGRKIVGALLQAFTLLKTHKLDNLDVRAQLFSGVLNILGSGGYEKILNRAEKASKIKG